MSLSKHNLTPCCLLYSTPGCQVKTLPFILPTVDPYVVLLPSTPSSAAIGQMVTISYTVATSFEQLQLEYFMNNFAIPNPVPSADNAQLLQYSFIANSSNGGNYTLILSKFVWPW